MAFDLSGKLSKKMMSDPKFREALDESKRVHLRTFGEILEPAFTDDPTGEIELVGALNFISRGEYDKALRKLLRIEKRCACPEDTCAVQFFAGLAYERSGMTVPAIQRFFASAAAVPGHYMTHVMLARLLHTNKSFDAALTNYLLAVQLIERLEPKDEVPAVNPRTLRSAMIAGAAGCSLMMGDYDDAEWALCEAESNGFDSPKLSVLYAMLYAATDRKALAREKLSELRKRDPELESRVALEVETVIAGKNPRFAVLKDALNAVDYEGFWQRFAERERHYAMMISSGSATALAAANELSRELTELFGFPNAELAVAVGCEKDGFEITVSDNYVLSLSVGVEKLLSVQPEELKHDWKFTSVH